MKTIPLGWIARVTTLVALWVAYEFGVFTVECRTDSECVDQCMRGGESFEQCEGYITPDEVRR